MQNVTVKLRQKQNNSNDEIVITQETCEGVDNSLAISSNPLSLKNRCISIN